MHEWIKRMWCMYIHNGILFSHKKKRKICNNIDRPGGHYAKWSKSEKYRLRSLMCGILKIYIFNLKTKLIDTKNRWVVARGGGE